MSHPSYRPCASFAFSQIEAICSLILVTSSMFCRLPCCIVRTETKKMVGVSRSERGGGRKGLNDAHECLSSADPGSPRTPKTSDGSECSPIAPSRARDPERSGRERRRKATNDDDQPRYQPGIPVHAPIRPFKDDVPFVVGDLRLELLDLLLVLPVKEERERARRGVRSGFGWATGLRARPNDGRLP
jgi:hypothetical protein